MPVETNSLSYSTPHPQTITEMEVFSLSNDSNNGNYNQTKGTNPEQIPRFSQAVEVPPAERKGIKVFVNRLQQGFGGFSSESVGVVVLASSVVGAYALFDHSPSTGRSERFDGEIYGEKYSENG